MDELAKIGRILDREYNEARKETLLVLELLQVKML